MIREATLEDLNDLVIMSFDFAEEAKVFDIVKMEYEDVRELIENIILSPSGIALRGPDSLLLGTVYPHPFNKKVKVFQEIVWRANDGNGLALLRLAEKVLKRAGVKKMTMVSYSSMPSLDKLYNRLGYSNVEKTFFKEL